MRVARCETWQQGKAVLFYAISWMAVVFLKTLATLTWLSYLWVGNIIQLVVRHMQYLGNFTFKIIFYPPASVCVQWQKQLLNLEHVPF